MIDQLTNRKIINNNIKRIITIPETIVLISEITIIICFRIDENMKVH